MTAGAGDRRFFDLLGVRLGLVLGLALLPIGLIAGFQSADLITKAQNHAETALIGETFRAVRPQIAAIQRAQGAAIALATLPHAMGDDCEHLLLRTILRGDFASATLYGADGSLRCSAQLGNTPLPPFPVQSRAATEGRSGIVALPGKDGPRLIVIEPAFDANGAVTGVATVALPALPDGQRREGDFTVALFGATGNWFAPNAPDLLLPPDLSLAERARQMTGQTAFSATSRSGELRSYAIVELVPGEVFALGSRPQERTGLSVLRSLPPLILPALMWAVSLVAAWVAAEQLVTRHIRRLRRAILDFADGSRIVRPLPMQGAPQEIRDTAEAFARMTTAILRDEADLEDAIHSKEVLLREVHHRVKNNLQLIASIVNMQIRRTKSEEARQMMRSLQERMLSLATIHNSLFRTVDVAEIRADQLFEDIVRSLVQAAAAQGRNVRLLNRFDPIRLSLDQAIPLALLMTEALSNALRYARDDGTERPRVSVDMVAEPDGTAVLEITNDTTREAGLCDDGIEEPGGISSQLLRGFARQLGGQLHRDFAEGRYRVTLAFRPRDAVSV
ncbi:MAG: hypothetical protein RL216_3514 [Pseudomonadota bacterium]